jgi:hypothetical protein
LADFYKAGDEQKFRQKGAMKKEYDFMVAKPNPYAKLLAGQIREEHRGPAGVKIQLSGPKESSPSNLRQSLHGRDGRAPLKCTPRPSKFLA